MIKLFAKRKLLIIGAVLLLAGGGLWWGLTRQDSPAVTYRYGQVARGIVAASVSASGNVRADQQANVSAQLSGTVTAVHVKPGDTVSADQPLYELQNNDIEADVAAAYGSYLEARQSVEQARAQVSEAEAARVTVYNDPASTDAQKNAASQQVTVAESGIAAAEQNKSVAWQRYDNVRLQAARRVVRAPMAGTVTGVSVKVGDQVGGGSRAASTASSGSNGGGGSSSATSQAATPSADVVIQNSGSLKAFVAVNEVDIAKVQAGQKARVTFDAFDDLTATGTVERVDIVGTDNQGVITYQAVIALDQVDPRLRPEMTLSAEITTEAKENVLYVPIAAVKSGANGGKYVEVMENNALKQVTVQTGLASNTAMEIVSGISEGARVITQTIQPSGGQATPVKGGAASTGLTTGNGSKGQ